MELKGLVWSIMLHHRRFVNQTGYYRHDAAYKDSQASQKKCSNPLHHNTLQLFRGSNSVVECQLPKLVVAGSIPVSRF